MMKDLIARKLEESIWNLFQEQPNFFSINSVTRQKEWNLAQGTNQSEWNIAFHLAKQIHLSFPQYDYDIELIKTTESDMRPDIVLHKRGSHNDNFLVVEVKRRKSGIQNALDKIKEHWFNGDLKYEYGSVVAVEDNGNFYVEVIENVLRRPRTV